jgi:hypothetical protein
MSILDLCLEVEELLGQAREEEPSANKREKLLVAIDAIQFIFAKGLSYDFEDYRKSLDANAPPLVIAAFKNLEEAEVWLQEQPRPPLGAQVLVTHEYYRVIYVRNTGLRKLLHNPGALTHYLEELTREGPPTPVATFSTRQEAEAWLHHQPEPPGHAFITIAGEDYVAVYHQAVKLRALYPVARSLPQNAS